ncbi:MAG: superoxide dismutase family protein [Ignavibacteriae bacterium]|nr:superoxide dismutase family protein [Ignavibacteriota bacterium]
MNRILLILLIVVIPTLLFAQMQHNHPMSARKVTKAIAVLHPTKDKNVHGWVTFEAVEKGVRVVAEITGLTPGKHGFHIHEFGDCSSDDGTTVGGHYNPMTMPHSAPMSDKRHIGDLGNIEANQEGVAKLDYVDSKLAFEGEASIIGRGVIVHEKEDDLKTQPTGDAGGRLACGVIGVAKK